MDLQQRTRRFGVFVILCACLLRLTLAGGTGWITAVLTEEVPFLTYLETGQTVRFSASQEKNFSHVRESPAFWLPEPAKPAFSPEEAAGVDVDYESSRRPDLGALLAQGLDWDLTGELPTVLILHTHATESYTKAGERYEETARYRTLEEEYNMLSVGDAVADVLEDAGIEVIHDRELHDHPSYNGSYVHARKTTEAWLQEYPSIRLILDLHRDASEAGKQQLRTVAAAAEEPTAQLMFVLGTDVTRPSHENWEQNLSLALKLQVLLNREYPGIVRPLQLRQGRFNQDLSPGALLVEVGAAGNTRQEALAAARVLGKAVAALAQGTEEA